MKPILLLVVLAAGLLEVKAKKGPLWQPYADGQCYERRKKDAYVASCDAVKSVMQKMGDLSDEIRELKTTVTTQQDLLDNITAAAVPREPSNCTDSKVEGVQEVIVGESRISVYCDQQTDGGGWTVIQKRFDGIVYFYQRWEKYENGFGDLNDEFWLGLSNIHLMTSSANYSLRVDLWDFEENHVYAVYDTFSIDGADANYTLHVSGYSGTAGDSLTYHNNMQFSTHDRDNDASPNNCAVRYHGAWWYYTCHRSNLNGLYKSSAQNGWDGINWFAWTKRWVSLKKTEMKIRPAV